VRSRVRAGLQARGQAAFGRFVRKRSDRQIDRTVGTKTGLRIIFKGMERIFRPDTSAGVHADIQYELQVAGQPKRWVVRITDRTIRTGPGVSPNPALTLRMDLSTFVRVIAGEVPAAQAFMEGKILMEGDVQLAMRMAEMFGQIGPT
jgi:putative sterol carrier protein